MKRFFLFYLFLFVSLSYSQTLLFEENFDYPAGDTLTDHGWTAYSGEGNEPIVLESSSLNFLGYPSSDIGGSIIVDANGEDVYSPLSSVQNSGIVYVSLLVNVSNATTGANGDYFFGFGSANAGTVAGRLYLMKSGSNFAFGISKTSGTPSFTGFDYSFGTTYLVVIKYIINSGSSNDDVAFFLFDGAIPETEPTPTITQPTESSSDPSSISVVALRQNSTTNIVTVDGIRVSDSWSLAPLPVELSSFSAVVLDNGVKLNWRTETEVNNYGFEILRQAQDDTWLVLGFVEGYGNSNSPKEYSFIDKNVSSGKIFYRLKQIDTDGQFQYSKIIEVDFGSPIKFELSQNYPNPFNPSTTIRFTLPQAGNVKLTVYNLLGEEVAQLVNEFKEAGVHTINFNASGLNSGVYIYKLEANGLVQTRKMTLLK